MKTATAVEVTPVALLVDRLGALKATITPLEAEYDHIVKQLKEAGEGRYAGELWDANVFRADRVSTDWKAIAEKVGYSPQLKSAHTSAAPVLTLKLTARNFTVRS